MAIFLTCIVLYLLVGWFISLLIERFKKEVVFDVDEYNENMPRFIFIIFWFLLVPVWGLFGLVITIIDSGWYEKLVKKIRGF